MTTTTTPSATIAALNGIAAGTVQAPAWALSVTYELLCDRLDRAQRRNGHRYPTAEHLFVAEPITERDLVEVFGPRWQDAIDVLTELVDHGVPEDWELPSWAAQAPTESYTRMYAGRACYASYDAAGYRGQLALVTAVNRGLGAIPARLGGDYERCYALAAVGYPAAQSAPPCGRLIYAGLSPRHTAIGGTSDEPLPELVDRLTREGWTGLVVRDVANDQVVLYGA